MMVRSQPRLARWVVPDSTKRRVVLEAFNYVFGGGLHRDEIFTEVTKQ